MNPSLYITRVVILICLLALNTVPAMAQAFSGWYEGAAGYHKAYAEHKRTQKPLLLYFYAPWCGYCRTLDRTLMVDSGVQDFLKPYIKVRVYPEESNAGQWLAGRLNINGYPSLRVWYAGDCSAEISPFVYDRQADDWVMESPDGFINKILKACD